MASIVFWLLMIYHGNAQAIASNGAAPNGVLLHVGNFSNLDNCVKAANNPDPKRGDISYVCVQANDDGTSPPN
jgi:hypothetical protein